MVELVGSPARIELTRGTTAGTMDVEVKPPAAALTALVGRISGIVD